MLVRSCISRRTATPCSSFIAVTHRHFHASAGQNAEPSNHYETLEVTRSATAAEIKKSFYKLSKANHPDLHPNDKVKSQRFVKVSEAYATLGSAEKKQRYDRDFFRSQQSDPSSHGHTPHGSHSSAQSGPGGRPASGLSRRRTQFRGPPPSFYRSGGWGEQTEKRQRNAENASHTYEARGEAASGPMGPGMGPGGFATGLDQDVPHFDRAGHHRTHTNLDSMSERRQRASRMRKQGASRLERESGGGGSMLFSFFVVGGTILGIMGVTGIVFGGPKPMARGAKVDE